MLLGPPPLQVCFLEPEMFSFLFWLNRMIDASFMADMGRQFCIPVTAWAGEEEGNVLIRDNWGIAQRWVQAPALTRTYPSVARASIRRVDTAWRGQVHTPTRNSCDWADTSNLGSS